MTEETPEVQLAVQEKQVSELSQSEIGVIRATYAKNSTDEEFNVYMGVCRHRNLNPFKGEVHFVKYGGQMSIVVGIHGLLKIAERGGSYAGRTPYYWCGDDGIWKEVWTEKGPPSAAKVGVYRKGNNNPVMSVATWISYHKDQPGPWRDMPDRMLAKCALAQALREACPDVDGLYIAEEFGSTIEDLKREPNVQSPRAAANHTATVSGFTSDDICKFGKKWQGRKWSEIEPDYLDYIIKNVDNKPDVVDRAKWEQDLRSGNIPTTADQNGEIISGDGEPDLTPDVNFLRHKIEELRKVAPKEAVGDIIVRLGDPTMISDPVLLDNIANEIQKVMKDGGS